jgi:1-deoxy-D-xylulose-5-phosphate reductoisomerase
MLHHYRDQFTVVAVVGGDNVETLAESARAVHAHYAVIRNESKGLALREALSGTEVVCSAGQSAILEALTHETDIVIGAISGTAGIEATYCALGATKSIALANKEVLVSAGPVFMRAADRSGVSILPLDSEHNALFQALGQRCLDDVERMTLTASGGAFLRWSEGDMAYATPAQALAHPVWSMGPKISIDSATLMNKGLELIEAHHLFGMPGSKLDVVIHPQSYIHGLVSFCDGSVVAGIASPDMRIPIAHCLGFPDRLRTSLPRFNPLTSPTLTFEAPDEKRFPALALARCALEEGGAMPTILNAANEIAVEAFLKGKIAFKDITHIVARTCDMLSVHNEEMKSLEHVFEFHHKASALALKHVTVYETA